MPSTTATRRRGIPPTAAQDRFLRTLLAERDPENPLVIRVSTILYAGNLTKRAAGDLIDALLTLPVTRKAPGAEARRNRYPDRCAICRSDVAANEGLLTKNDRGRWITTCATPCTAPETPASTGLDLADLDAGWYAVPNGETRLKVQIDKPTEGRWAGYIFVTDGAAYGQRRRYGTVRPGSTIYDGMIQDELRAIMADPHEAMRAYGRLVGRCGRCHRVLEDETSVAEGLGPYCRRML